LRQSYLRLCSSFIPRRHTHTLFPYTTLFRSVDEMVKKGTFKQSKGKLRVNEALHSTVERLLADGLIDFDMTSDWQTALDNIHSDDEAMAFIDDNRKNTKDVHDKFKQLLNV